MDQVRIGMVGAGLIGEIHAAVLQQTVEALGRERVHLAGVADTDTERAERLVKQFGFERGHRHHRELLDRADLDAVFVCTPTRFHAEVVAHAVQRGLHVFCEKPLAMSYAEARAMAEGVERAGLRAQTGLVLRFSPVYTRMRNIFRRPEMGRPMAVLFRDDQCFPIRGLHASGWRKDPSLTAGGTLIEHGVHDIDVLAWFFGRIARVRAWERNFAGHAGVEDYLAAEIEHENGTRAQLVNLWHNVTQRHSNRRLEIFCENGFLASNDDMLGSIQQQVGGEEERSIAAENILEVFLSSKGLTDHPMARWLGIPYALQDLSFVEALLEERQPFPGLREGLEAQRVAEAIYAAARTGEEIEVGSFGRA